MFNNKIILKSQKRFKSDHHKVCTEEVNKIGLSSNDDIRLQTFDKITMYPYGTNAFKVCESEMLNRQQWALWLNWYPSVYSTIDFYKTVKQRGGPELPKNICLLMIK